MIKSILFDFDGVLVESVDIKTKAFAALFADRGQDIVRQVVQYHLDHGGVSRYEKIKYYYQNILQEELSGGKLQELCNRFSEYVLCEVVAAPWVRGAEEFLQANSDKYVLFVVSGTPEAEMKQIVQARGMIKYFKAIHGSPVVKTQLVASILEANQLPVREVVLVGDAPSDLEAARKNGIRFIGRIKPGIKIPFACVDFPVISDLSNLDDMVNKL